MVSKIRELCKKNKTSVAALERQLGFGNGVIGRWDKSVPNYDRLYAVAEALGVTVSELTGETDTPETKKAAPEIGDGYTAEQLELAKKLSSLSAEDLQALEAVIDALLSKH